MIRGATQTWLIAAVFLVATLAASIQYVALHGYSLAIAMIGIRAVVDHRDLGGASCTSAPIDYGSDILLYFVLATLAVLSHAPVARANRCRSR